jgi:diguanylate cyclase (GGDEF)-like protein
VHIDIDRFKSVNDAFGRAAGDAVLRALAERLRAWTRSSGVLARIGSNAFIFLFSDLATEEHAAVVAQRLLTAIEQPIAVESQFLVLTASIGISLFPGDATDLPTLSRCAEQAAYAAKSSGRARHRFFDESMNVHATNRLLLESDLRRAITDSELRLYFQPKVDAGNGALVGVEALVRWQHPERGLLPPGEFIALAEESGLILPLTDKVLESACCSLRAWLDAGLKIIPLSVNLAAPCLMDMTLLDKLDALMQRFDLLPEYLILEMTETMLMRDMDTGIELLQKLRNKGYGLSLDDFGTGYSSLSYLRRFPVHELKIDRSFVTDSAQGGRDAVLATAIIALGREFGMKVVAEGVETQAQSTFLQRNGCSTQQGFLFSRPVSADVFMHILQHGLPLLEAPQRLIKSNPICADAA